MHKIYKEISKIAIYTSVGYFLGCQPEHNQNNHYINLNSRYDSNIGYMTIINKDNNIAQISIPGLRSPLLQFVNGNLKTLDMELFFDTFLEKVYG